VLAAMVLPFLRIGGVVEPHEVNGQPGAILLDPDGKVTNTWALDILEGQIRPAKCVELGPTCSGRLDRPAEVRR
jgi:RNA polymerase sigma-70 factor, ECF subfamily